MPVQTLDHYNIETVKLDQTVNFYMDVLDMTLGDRPPLDIPGAWLCASGHPCIHINEVTTSREGPTGPIDHVAFEATDIDLIVSKLQELHVEYEYVDSRPKLPLQQIYIVDPNGIRIELNIRGD